MFGDFWTTNNFEIRTCCRKLKPFFDTYVERWHELEFVQEEKLARSKQIEEDHSD